MFVMESEEAKLINYINEISSIKIFNNGVSTLVFKGQDDFKKITNKLKELFSISRIMPAFGVSLHNETLNALKSDMWLQINFNKKLTINQLDFQSLLFKLEQTGGINLIRKNNNQFTGRCIYLDLQSETDLTTFLF